MRERDSLIVKIIIKKASLYGCDHVLPGLCNTCGKIHQSWLAICKIIPKSNSQDVEDPLQIISEFMMPLFVRKHAYFVKIINTFQDNFILHFRNETK